jgi:hypothetical protein
LGPEVQATYGQGRITPIWTDGGEYTIIAYHHAGSRRGFFRFDIESPGEEEHPIGLSWQQVLGKLVTAARQPAAGRVRCRRGQWAAEVTPVTEAEWLASTDLSGQ